MTLLEERHSSTVVPEPGADHRAAAVAGAAVLGLLLLALLAPWQITFGVIALAVVAALGYLATTVPPAVWFALELGSQIFSGNSRYVGLPISPDRLLLVAGVFSLYRALRRGQLPRRVCWGPTHLVLLVTAAYAVVSALAASTLMTTGGIFSLLDRLGMVPFAFFTVAPLVFGDRKGRNVLLVTLTTVGAYLAFTAFLEGVGLNSLAIPSYIGDPSIGLHFGRARGPFVEAVADGLGLFECGVAAGVGVFVWTGRRARVVGAVIALACALGTVFTLTRAVWLATAISVIAVLVAVRRFRKLIAPVLVLGALAVGAAFVLVPSLSSEAGARVSDQRPIWDRYNVNNAALRIVDEKPLFGIGWQTFAQKGPSYYQQAEGYPITGAGIEVHNVFLSHAAELGLVGALLWLGALAACVGRGVLRRAPPALDPWRVGLLAVGLNWLIVASFGPLSYPFPNSLLWAWAGVVLVPVTSRLRAGYLDEDAQPEPVGSTAP